MRVQATHRSPNRIFHFAAGAALICALAAPVVTYGADDHAETLPTPFSAAEIRDGWPQGFWLDTTTTSAQGERIGRTIVTRWAVDEVTLIEVVLEQGVEPTQEQIAAAEPVTMTWDELEGHARFDAARTTRERTRRTTALGADLEGWLYRVAGSDGAESFFFFADDFPGPPVLYWQVADGVTQFRAEQTARKPVV